MFFCLNYILLFDINSVSNSSRLLPLVSGQRFQRKMKAHIQMPL